MDESQPKRPPIVVRAKPLDALASFSNLVRTAQKMREQPKEYDGIAAWEQEARKRFGPDKRAWKWRCHHCDAIFTSVDCVIAGMPVEKIGYACIGTYVKSHPCRYDGNKPLPANPLTIHLPGGQKARMLSFAGD